MADNGFSNAPGQLSYLALQHPPVTAIGIPGAFQLASVAYVPGSSFGVVASGGQHQLLPFGMNGSGAGSNTPIDLSNANCMPTACAYAAAVVMPDPSTAIVANNTTGDNYLVEVSGVNSGSQTYATIPITGNAEDTAGLAMSSDGKVLLTRGAFETAFAVSGLPPYTFTETGQLGVANGIDNPDHSALRGREGMYVFNMGGDYQALIAGTAGSAGGGCSCGTVWLAGGLATSPHTITSTAITNSGHAYAATTDGHTAFIGTDKGIAVVPGVDMGSFAATTTTIVSPAIGNTGSTLVQVSSLAVTPDHKWLVVMGLPSSAAASTPGGSGYIMVLPISSVYTHDLGPAVGPTVQVPVPNNDQLVVY